MNQPSVARSSSRAEAGVPQRHAARDEGRGGATSPAATQCELRLRSYEPDPEDIGMRWAIAWYRNTQSRTRMGECHVAA